MKKTSWEVYAFEGEAPLLIVEGENCIAECFIGDGGESVEKAISNAKLIAAAPDLFAALTAILAAGDLTPALVLMSERAVNKTGGWGCGIDCTGHTENEEDLIDNERDFYAAIREERAKLREFAQEIMSHWPERDIDGDDLQEIAERHWLIEPTVKYKPCSEGCFCSGYVSKAEFESGALCFVRTELLTGEPPNHAR